MKIVCLKCGYERLSTERCMNQLCHGPQVPMNVMTESPSERAYDKLAVELAEAKAEIKRLTIAYEERGMAMRETGDMVRSYMNHQIDSRDQEIAALRSVLSEWDEDKQLIAQLELKLARALERHGQNQQS